MGRAFDAARGLTLPAGSIVIEVGSDRGEGSTALLAEIAAANHTSLITIDIDADIAKASPDLPHVTAVTGFAEDWMTRHLPDQPPVGLAYLDGADWPYPNLPEPVLISCADRYAAAGASLSPAASMASHLACTALLREHAAPDCVFIFDDTWRGTDGWTGKGGWAVPYLLARGYTITSEHSDPPGNDHSVVLTRAVA